MTQSFEPFDRVRVTGVCDDVPPGIRGTSTCPDDVPCPYVGMVGRVAKLDYATTNGKRYPEDPLYIVVFADLPRDGFWGEELELVDRPALAPVF